MPAAAWPLTVQRYEFAPFLIVTFRVAVLPDWSSGVVLPAILKSCGRLPLFVTLKVTAPAGTDDFDSLNLNSLGEPAVTVTVVARAAVCFAVAGSTHSRAAATTVRPRTQNFFVMRSKLLSHSVSNGRQGSPTFQRQL